nr:hypothetical protein BaRGS_016776 [Batillaria attramentaria]
MQTSLNARISDLQNKLNTYATTVGFHAWGSVSPVNTVSKGTVILGHVKTNDGNAYDPNTGLFTAPVPGLYYFHATFMDHDLSDRIDALISVDGAAVAGTVADSRHGYWDNPAVAAVVHLNAGQKVQLQSNNNEVDHFYGGLYTTFSGFLIRAD